MFLSLETSSLYPGSTTSCLCFFVSCRTPPRPTEDIETSLSRCWCLFCVKADDKVGLRQPVLTVLTGSFTGRSNRDRREFCCPEEVTSLEDRLDDLSLGMSLDCPHTLPCLLCGRNSPCQSSKENTTSQKYKNKFWGYGKRQMYNKFSGSRESDLLFHEHVSEVN